jgi:membrane fusion protein, multidrug efflux system
MPLASPLRRSALFLLAAILAAPPGPAPRAMAQEAGGEAPPPAVVVAPVAAEPVRTPAEFVGRVEAIRSLEVRARVQGFITEVAFEEGAAVQAGQLLFRLDPAQYEAELAAAEAGQFRARANLEEAQRNLARVQELAQGNIAPQAQVEEATAGFRSAQADWLAAKADVRLAQLSLSYTRIESGIDGQVGRALYHRGALVGPESGALARVVQLDPIRVVFSLTEGALVGFRQARARGEAGAASRGGFAFRLLLPNGEPYGPEGRLDFVESEVSPNTGTVAVRVTYDNPDRLLLPGLFVTLIAAERDPERQPVAPFSAVQRDREGPFVHVLDEAAGTVARRRIETGARLRRGWSVTAGLAPGEVLVVQGTQRLRDGARVRAVPQETAGPTPLGAPVRESRR